MQQEKIALIALVIVVVAALSTFLIAINTDIFENLFEGQKRIEYGDYADVQYIGYYASNNTIFDSSYEYPNNKTGGSAAKLFVTLDMSATPDANFSGYSNTINDFFIPGFIENLVGLGRGEKRTTAVIPPEQAYGISPKAGDIIDLRAVYEYYYGEAPDINLSYTILSIQKNGTVPEPYNSYFGNTSTIFTVRENSHYIGEVVDLYAIWTNVTVVTKINETKLWTYTTPPENQTDNLTWTYLDEELMTYTTYPTNCSTITSIDNDTIVITHSPPINSTISIQTQTATTIYTIENVTDDTINTSVSQTGTGNKTYYEFDRQIILQRNETQNITQDVPGELMELQLFNPMRSIDPEFHISYHPLTDKAVYFEVEIIKVYKAS
ncbi:MAG: FKBP-type peptidyl-prolyl cis-trans isomerase [Candidatus Thermoplasmatota archaeon]|nr:FKBP-type peptidyl-prolyl cis-trans isomerase [Candidatus Thermoplasmatota archaeon]